MRKKITQMAMAVAAANALSALGDISASGVSRYCSGGKVHGVTGR
jgi:hypothetical protein